MVRSSLSLRLAPLAVWLGFIQISFLIIAILDTHWQVGTDSAGNKFWIGLYQGCVQPNGQPLYSCRPASDWPADTSCSNPDSVAKGQHIILGIAIAAACFQFVSTVLSLVGSACCDGKSTLWNSVVLIPSCLSVGCHVGAAVAITSQFSCPAMPDDTTIGYAAILLFVGCAFGVAAVLVKFGSAAQVCCSKPDDAYMPIT